MATAAPPLTRETANRLVADLVHRARDLNADDRWAYRVRVLIVFGRRADQALTNMPKIDPTVAWACADTFTIAITAFLTEVPRVRWLIDDVGLTTAHHRHRLLRARVF